MKCMKYLTRRAGGFWYVQLAVPRAAQPAMGRKTVERSTGTTCLTTATERKWSIVAEFKRQFEQAERSPQPAKGAAALLELAQHAWAGAVSEDDFEGSVEGFLDRQSKDAGGEPQLSASDLALVRRATAIAGGSQLLDALASQWVAHEATKGVQRDTIEDRRAHLDRLLTFAGSDARASDLTRNLAVRYVEDLLNPAPISLQRKQFILGSARRFADWLQVRQFLPDGSNPFDKVGMLLHAEDTSREKRELWTPQHLQTFLQQVEAGDPLFALVALCAYLGCRPQDICNVRCQDVTASTITIVKSKTNAGQRTLPIPSTLAPLVASLVDTSTDGWLLSGLLPFGPDGDRYKLLGNRTQTVRGRIGMGESRPVYSLRHTCVTMMTEAGISEEVRERIIGHVSDSVMARHYDMSKRLSTMADALATITYGSQVDRYVAETGRNFRITLQARPRKQRQ